MVGYSLRIFLLKMKNKIVWVHINFVCRTHLWHTRSMCLDQFG